MIGRLLGIEAPLDAAPARGRGPAAHARGFFSAVRSVIEGDGAPQPARARVRGHPLGRPRNARPDRVPRPVGARPAAAAVPGARRAARAPHRLGRRAPRGDLDPARPADASSRRASWSASLLGGRRRRRRTRSRRSPSARAATRSSPRRWRAGWPTSRAASCSSCPTPCRPARRAARLARARRAACSSSTRRWSGRTFWEGALGDRRARATTGTRDALHAPPGEGHHRARTAACGSRASASTRSSTC